MKLFGQYQFAQPRGLQAVNQAVVCDGYRLLSLQQVNAADRAPWHAAICRAWLRNSVCANGTALVGLQRQGERKGCWHRMALVETCLMITILN